MAKCNPIKLVAFDLGEVLVNVDKAALPSALGISSHDTDRAFFKPGLFSRFVNGEMAPSAYFSQIALDLRRSPDEVESAFRKMVTPRHYCENLIPLLKVPFTFWSNTNLCHFEQVIQSSSLLAKYSQIGGLSFELGFSKPSPQFFERSIRNSGLQGSDIFYLDDKEKNVEMARRFSVQAQVVHTYSEIVDALSLRELF